MHRVARVSEGETRAQAVCDRPHQVTECGVTRDRGKGNVRGMASGGWHHRNVRRCGRHQPLLCCGRCHGQWRGARGMKLPGQDQVEVVCVVSGGGCGQALCSRWMEGLKSDDSTR